MTAALDAAAALDLSEAPSEGLSPRHTSTLLAALRKGGADALLADPLLLNAIGSVAARQAKEEDAAGRAGAAHALLREASAAYRLALAVEKDDAAAAAGLKALGEWSPRPLPPRRRTAASLSGGGGAISMSSMTARGNSAAEVGEDEGWQETLGGSSPLAERLELFLTEQRRAVAWLAGEGGEGGGGYEAGKPPRILVGVMPNVGLGNQILTIIAFLAHALVTGRSLFLIDSHLQCLDAEWGDVPQTPGSDMALLCGSYFRMRHEQRTTSDSADPVPLWRLAAVLERAKASGSLSRFHAAYPAAKRLHYYFRPNPERQQAVEHFVCTADAPGGEEYAEAHTQEPAREHAALLVVQTTQYYVPLLASNARLRRELHALFVQVDTSALPAGAPPRPFEPDLDVFGPLFRFFLRPSAEVEAAVNAFAAEHFAGAARVVGLHMRGGIPGADNQWVNAFGRGPASLNTFERNARRCTAAVALNESAAASDAADEGSDVGDVVVFVASDNAMMRQRVVHSLHRLNGVVAVSYTPAVPEEQGAAMRAKAGGMLVAVIEMMILARCDVLVRTGSRGYSSYSYVAAGAMYRPTGPPLQFIVAHPCDEDKQWPKGTDCVVEMHTQPRLNMWWPPHDTETERGRVSCELRAPDGATQTLAQQLAARGVMDLQCQDIAAMHRWHQAAGTGASLRYPGTLLPQPGKAHGKTEL